VNARLAHPSLDDLIDARPAPAVQVHLTACTVCQAEARRWDAAAAVIHQLCASAQPPSWDPGTLPATVGAGHPSLPLARLARHRRVQAACAALVLLGGAAGGAIALSGGGRGPATAIPGTRISTTVAGVTAVTGCSGLEAAVGTLQRSGSAGVTIRTSNGAYVTVTVPASATVTRLVGGSVSSLSDGQHVVVSGTDDNGTLAAARVNLVPDSEAGMPRGLTLPSGPGLGQLLLTLGHASGTVTGRTSTGFIVAESDGTKVPVTTSRSTLLIAQVSSTLAQLKQGEQTVAVGTASGEGTLTARQVEQRDVSVGQPYAGSGRSPAGSHECSPASVAAAELTSAS
jgi:anti-sigma factor RsiW